MGNDEISAEIMGGLDSIWEDTCVAKKDRKEESKNKKREKKNRKAMKGKR